MTRDDRAFGLAALAVAELSRFHLVALHGLADFAALLARGAGFLRTVAVAPLVAPDVPTVAFHAISADVAALMEGLVTGSVEVAG
jgi:hypothetical protein